MRSDTPWVCRMCPSPRLVAGSVRPAGWGRQAPNRSCGLAPLGPRGPQYPVNLSRRAASSLPEPPPSRCWRPFHVAAIWSFIHLGTTRERADERLVQLILLALKRPPPAAPADIRPPMPAPRRWSRRCRPSTWSRRRPSTRPRWRRRPLRIPSGAAGRTGVAAPAPPSWTCTIPKDFYAHPPPLTPAQEAMRDPRSNHLELTKQEKLDIAFEHHRMRGLSSCARPDGSMLPRAGALRRASRASTPTRSPGTSPARRTAARSASKKMTA